MISFILSSFSPFVVEVDLNYQEEYFHENKGKTDRHDTPCDFEVAPHLKKLFSAKADYV